MTNDAIETHPLIDGKRHRVQVERVGFDWGTNNMEQSIVIFRMRLPDGTAACYRGRSKQMIRAIGEEYLPQFALTATFEPRTRGRSSWLELNNPTKVDLTLRQDGLVPSPETLEGAWHRYSHDHAIDEDGAFWVFSGDTLMKLWLRVRETPVPYRVEGNTLYIGRRNDDYQIRFLDADQLILEWGDNYLVYRRYRKPINMSHFRFTA
jgi:hypothetical protein